MSALRQTGSAPVAGVPGGLGMKKSLEYLKSLRAKGGGFTFPPLDAWKAIKATLRTQLGEREWGMWIQHARLWRVLGETSDRCMVIEMPRSKAVFGAQRHMKTMKRLARKMGFALSLTVEMDEHQLATYRERYGEPTYLEEKCPEAS